MPTEQVPQFTVAVTGLTGLKDVQCVRLSGREEISRPFKYELELAALSTKGSGGAVKAETLLGHSVTVAIGYADGTPFRYINGVLAELAQVGYGQRYHQYRAVMRPAFWLLTRRADCRVFQKKSVPDIFEDVCTHSGVSIPIKRSLGATYNPWEYRVQYRESDFDFLSRLLEHEGIFYYFEHSKDKHEIVLADDVARLTEVRGYDRVPYYPPTTGHAQRTRDHLDTWEIHESFQPAAFAATEYDFEKPRAAANAVAPVAKRTDSATYEVFDYPAGVSQLDASHVEKLAKLRAEQFRSAQALVRASGDAAGLAAGRRFSLTEHPRDDFNKGYVVVSTDLTIQVPLNETGAAGYDSDLSISITAVDSALPYRPACVTPKPVIQGTQTARIVGPSDKEIWTDKYGRVKVKFHWDRAGKDDGNSSCWVRVAQSWAGTTYGTQFVPRIAQEVVVSFLEGDPDRPIVIGSVYNGDHLPPFELPANATQSGLRTDTSAHDSSVPANELRFEDKKGEQEIYLHAAKNMQIVIENNQTVKVGTAKKDKGDRTVTVANDDTLNVDHDLKVNVKHDEERIVKGARSAQVEGDDSVNTKKKYRIVAGEEISLTVGQAKIVMKKDGTIEISGVDVKLKGNKGVTVDGTKTAISGTQVDLSGTKTSVAGKASLDLQASGVASLKGSMTKIG